MEQVLGVHCQIPGHWNGPSNHSLDLQSKKRGTSHKEDTHSKLQEAPRLPLLSLSHPSGYTRPPNGKQLET